jgi:hypothetical protein
VDALTPSRLRRRVVSPRGYADIGPELAWEQCCKALWQMVPKFAAGDRVELKASEFPPCRVCRAFWRQCCARYKVSVEYQWPGGTWSEESALPLRAPHNRVLAAPCEDDQGMVVFAEEDERCSLWGCRGEPTDDAAEVYQSDLGDEDHGPWLPMGVSRAAFLSDLMLWNRANGGAAASVVGAQGKETAARLRALTLTLERPDFLTAWACGARPTNSAATTTGGEPRSCERTGRQADEAPQAPADGDCAAPSRRGKAAMADLNREIRGRGTRRSPPT